MLWLTCLIQQFNWVQWLFTYVLLHSTTVNSAAHTNRVPTATIRRTQPVGTLRCGTWVWSADKVIAVGLVSDKLTPVHFDPSEHCGRSVICRNLNSVCIQHAERTARYVSLTSHASQYVHRANGMQHRHVSQLSAWTGSVYSRIYKICTSCFILEKQLNA